VAASYFQYLTAFSADSAESGPMYSKLTLLILLLSFHDSGSHIAPVAFALASGAIRATDLGSVLTVSCKNERSDAPVPNKRIQKSKWFVWVAYKPEALPRYSGEIKQESSPPNLVLQAHFSEL